MAAPAPEAGQYPGRAGAHQVQRGGVGRAATDDHRNIQLVDELLEVQRLGLAGHVLGGHGGAADHEDVRARVQDGLVVAHGALRGQPRRRGDPGGADLRDPAADQVLLDRRGVDLLEPARGFRVVQAGHLGEDRLRVLVTCPEPFEVEDGEAAEPADRHRRGRRDHAVHRADHQRQVEPVRVDLPGGGHLLGIPGAPGRDDPDLVKGVGPAAALTPADLDGHASLPR